MQELGCEFIEQARQEKMRSINLDLRQEQVGGMVECPECHYISKNKRFSCKVFPDAIKCFACGLWRKLT